MAVYLITLSLLIAVVLLLRAVFGKKVSPRLSYALWLAVAVKLCLPFAEFEWKTPEIPAETQQTAEALRLPEIPEPAAYELYPITVAPPDRYEAEDPSAAVSAQPDIPAVTGNPVESAEAKTEPAPAPAEKAPVSLKTVLIAGWIIGSAVTAVWLTFTAVRFRKSLRASRTLYGKAGYTRIYLSEHAGEPCTVGWSVYLTPDAAYGGSAELILRHELTHIRHLDPLWSAVRMLALTAYWWNPLIWAAAFASKRDSELACDDAVAASLDDGERLRYARTLVETAAKMHERRLVPGTERFGCPPLKERVLRLTVRRKSSLLCGILAAALCFTAAGCSFGSLPESAAKTPAPEQRQPQTPAIANDPVAYAASDDYVTPEKQSLLTHVFLGNELEKSGTYSYGCLVQDLEEMPDGYTFCGIRYETQKNAEGKDCLHRDYALITVNDDGSIREEKPFTLDSDEYDIIDMLKLNGQLSLLVSGYPPDSYTTDYFVIRLDPETGEMQSSPSLCPLTDSAAENQFCHADGLTADADGNLYVYMEGAPFCEILVMGAGMQKQFSVSMTDSTYRLMRGRDGRVYYSVLDSTYVNSGGTTFKATVYPVDYQAKKTGVPVLTLNQLVRGVYACPDHDFCYSTDNALYTVDFLEDGSAKVDILIDYVNSSITTAQMCVEILDIRDDDTVLLKERTTITFPAATELFRRTDDIDLSKIKVIELALSRTDQDNYGFDEAVAKFNKTHADARILIRDYRIYATEDDPQNGERRLMMDLLTGIYRPDVVIGQAENPLIQGVLSQKLYADLSPYLDHDPALKDDVLGCVRRTFTDSDGVMWGITDKFWLSSLFGQSDMLNGLTGWTMTEFLDYVETMPKDSVLLNGLCQTNFAEKLMGNSGWNAFLDWENHTASFDSPDFMRLLEYWKSLPKEERAFDPEEAHPDYVSGKIVLHDESWRDIGEFLRPPVIFETEEVTPIGKIAAEGSSGSTLTGMNCFVMTAWNEYPAETWEFISSVMRVEPDPHGYNLLPATKSGLDKLGKSAKSMTYRIYYDGGRGESSGLADAAKLDRPGAIAYYTDETHAALTEFLDHQAGAPLSAAVPEEVSAIVNEEVSAYLAGAKSAEDCARIIQSRVSIWMQEHA